MRTHGRLGPSRHLPLSKGSRQRRDSGGCRCGTFSFAFACKVLWSEPRFENGEPTKEGPRDGLGEVREVPRPGSVRRGSREDLFTSVEIGLTNSGPSKVHCCVLSPSWVMWKLRRAGNGVMKGFKGGASMGTPSVDDVGHICLGKRARVLESDKLPWSKKSQPTHLRVLADSCLVVNPG